MSDHSRTMRDVSRLLLGLFVYVFSDSESGLDWLLWCCIICHSMEMEWSSYLVSCDCVSRGCLARPFTLYLPTSTYYQCNDALRISSIWLSQRERSDVLPRRINTGEKRIEWKKWEEIAQDRTHDWLGGLIKKSSRWKSSAFIIMCIVLMLTYACLQIIWWFFFRLPLLLHRCFTFLFVQNRWRMHALFCQRG